MSVFKPRNRLVNFRLSDDEFDKLKSLCPLHGARSISDFARSSVLERLERTPQDAIEPVSAAPRPLDHKVTQLETRVDQLVNLLNAVGFTNGSGPGAAPGTHAMQELRRPAQDL